MLQATSREPGRVLIVTSGENFGVPRLARVLREGGCHVTLMCRGGLMQARSRYVNRFIPAPGDILMLVEAVRMHLADPCGRDYAWVIVADDSLLWALGRRADEGWLAPWFPVEPALQSVRVLLSKVGFAQAAARAGLAMPRFAVAAGADARETAHAALAAAREVGYPVMLKKDYGCAGQGVARADGPGELAAAAERFAGRGDLLVQECLDWQVGAVEALYDRGRPLCWLTSLKARTWPGPYGPSCARELFWHADVEPLLRGVGALTGQHGFGGFDFLHDPASGRLVVIELHARPTTGLALGVRAGADFPAAVRAMLGGAPRTIAPRPALCRPATAPISLFPQDLDRAIDTGRWGGWLCAIFRANDIPWDDRPLLRAHAGRAWRRLRGIARGHLPPAGPTMVAPAAPADMQLAA